MGKGMMIMDFALPLRPGMVGLRICLAGVADESTAVECLKERLCGREYLVVIYELDKM